ncbi:hypothetical protein BDQ17DRAFT_1329343 [Cyathus striatus]|nr:hypothetical protein BDQ17DRAFT_1329343 [Cyathus striatus]
MYGVALMLILVAALVVLLYDHASTFRFEYNHIWKHPLTHVKYVYLFCRYFGLISQIYWFAFLIITGLPLGTALHVVIVLRVYALHQKDYKVVFSKRNIETQYANIINKVVRDGGNFFVLMLGMSLSVLMLPSVQVIRTTFLIFSFWSLNIFSILSCRLIKGLLQLSTVSSMDHSKESYNDVELTSFIDVEYTAADDMDKSS